MSTDLQTNQETHFNPFTSLKRYLVNNCSWQNASVLRVVITLICLALSAYFCLYFGTFQAAA